MKRLNKGSLKNKKIDSFAGNMMNAGYLQSLGEVNVKRYFLFLTTRKQIKRSKSNNTSQNPLRNKHYMKTSKFEYVYK